MAAWFNLEASPSVKSPFRFPFDVTCSVVCANRKPPPIRHIEPATMSTPASARPSRKARSSTPKYVIDSDEDDIGSDDSPIEIDGDDSSVEPSKPSTGSKRAPRRSAASAKKASYRDADSDDDDDESSFHSSSASDVMSVDSSFSDDDFGSTTSSAKKKKKAAPAKAKAKKAPAAKVAKTPASSKKKAALGAAARTKKSPAAATPTSSTSGVTTPPASKKKAAASAGSAAKAKTVTPPNTLHESVDVVLPQSILSLGSSGGSAPADCTVLVQIDPKDAMSTLDFHGASGAIGRFEADDEGITMDFKGFQYQGIIHPGPTAMIASINAKSGQMKVESITDEFVTLEKTHDVMARLDAQVEGDLDEGYSTKGHDANVNYSGARGGSGAAEAANDGGGGKKSGEGKKRASGGGGTSAKKRKAAPKK